MPKSHLLFEKVSILPNDSFRVKESITSSIDVPWHYHPEYELTLIIKSKGKRFVGDSIEDFYEGDLILIGPNVPHNWLNDDEYYKTKKLKIHDIVIHFRDDCFGKDFFTIPEAKAVAMLLSNSRRGIKITGKTHEQLSKMMVEITKISGFNRVIYFLNMLQLLSQSDDLEFLSSRSFAEYYMCFDTERINKIFEYVGRNYAKNIELKEVAEIVNMTPNSFCRFFKKRANKTFYSFLMEIRIGYACKLLLENKYNIEEICFKTGYNNLSSFFRYFKLITRTTPKNYLAKHLSASKMI